MPLPVTSDRTLTVRSFSMPHPFISLITPIKGKKLLPRVARLFDIPRMQVVLTTPERTRHAGGGNVMALGLEGDPTRLPIFPMTQLSSMLLWLPSGEFDS